MGDDLKFIDMKLMNIKEFIKKEKDQGKVVPIDQPELLLMAPQSPVNGEAQGVCHGDSGGPVTIINSKKEVKLVGIISGHYASVDNMINNVTPDECGTKDGYSLFESIHAHEGWIKTTMDANP